jgi:hypothetical protein
VDYVACWHRGRKRKNGHVCVNCGVACEECPCACYRAPQGACTACNGSGWVAIVRGNVAKFREYIERDYEGNNILG